MILLWPSREVQAWGASALFALPLLVWLLTSRAVRDAPPFDDRAFHRTLPPGDRYAFWRVVRFHLFGFAGIAAIVAAYCWLNNLGWLEVIWGIAVVMIPATAGVSVFGVVSSLSTSRQHWAGWPYINIMLIPAIPSLWFVFRIWKLDGMAALAIMILACSLFFPFIWWLVGARGRRKIGTILGMIVVFICPLFCVFLQPLDSILQKSRQAQKQSASAITIRRVSSERFEGLDIEEANHIFEHIEVIGLEEDEFIWINCIFTEYDPKWYLRVIPNGHLVRVNEAFATASDGRAVPGSESFSRVFSREMPASQMLQRTSQSHSIFSSLLYPTGHSINRSHAIDQQKMDLANGYARPWLLSGGVFKWRKLADFKASDGGRCWLPHNGGIQVMPIEEASEKVMLTVYVDRGALAPSDPFIPLESRLVLVAVDLDGHAMILELAETNYAGRFLISRVQLDSTGGFSGSRSDLVDFERLRRSRLHVFWPEFKGIIEAELPVPE